jgi:hypothetical protein
MATPQLKDRIYRRLHSKEIANREDQTPQLLTDLVNSGLTPPEATDALNKYDLSGELNLPRTRTRMLQPGVDLEANPDLPERSTQEPIKYRQRRPGLYAFDKSKGTFTETPVPDDVSSVNVSDFESDPKRGQTIYVDNRTGQELRREPNGTNHNNVVKIDPTGGSGGAESPEMKAAQETHAKYLEKLNQKDAKGNPMPIPDDLTREMESAAPLLGMRMEDVKIPGQEGFIKRALRSTPLTRPLAGPPPADGGYKRPVFAAPGASGGGKKLNPDQAKLIFEAAGRDPQKARELARQHGYSF